MGDIALRGNKLTKGPHGFGPKPFLNKPGQAQGTHGGKAIGGMVRRPKKPSTHGKDVPTMAAEGGRIGLKHGKGPHGFGPKPYLHKPGVGPHGQPGGRKSKAAGKLVVGGVKKIKKYIDTKKGKFPETESLVHQKGPYVGDVGSEGKKAVPRAGRPKSPGVKSKRPWGGTPPQLKKSVKERREELRKKARKSGGHSKIIFADEWKHIDPGLQKGLFKKEGGRIGLRTGSRGPSAGERIKARKARADEWWTAKHGTGRSFHPGIDKQLREKRPHSSPEGRAHDVKKIMSKHRTDKIQADVAKFKRTAPSGRALHKEGGRIGFKKGTDKKWMQKVSASIKKRGTKGKCTPITKPGCTGRAKALAKTFKKIAAKRKA